MKSLISFLLFFSISQSIFAAKAPKKLSLPVANDLIAKALACGNEKGWSLSVAVVNSEGSLIAFQRSDDAFVGSIKLSIAKAKSSNAFRKPTKAFADGVSGGNVGLVSVDSVIANAGGVPVAFDGTHMGGIGVSGATAAQDELCALAALKP